MGTSPKTKAAIQDAIDAAKRLNLKEIAERLEAIASRLQGEVTRDDGSTIP